MHIHFHSRSGVVEIEVQRGIITGLAFLIFLSNSTLSRWHVSTPPRPCRSTQFFRPHLCGILFRTEWRVSGGAIVFDRVERRVSGIANGTGSDAQGLAILIPKAVGIRDVPTSWISSPAASTSRRRRKGGASTYSSAKISRGSMEQIQLGQELVNEISERREMFKE